MSFISLRDIGKIYVSDGSVAVGIRGVNLDFDIGEFVAVTGKSGSGKTTLLNILSGMDTYEEGQLYINGEETAHYSQADWEIYRQKYVSFIFQDYNILESFTVLQNVELALSHIESKKERRERALELIERVGLSKFKHHKGSKLSGGQKQRTVIARALAKDSPMILADEPCGNLDYNTSKEIIKLLYEISKEKLVVVVTHSFEEMEEHATREIRIFDGSVESDRELKKTEKICECKKELRRGAGKTLLRGIELGITRFSAMPKLAIFTSILMIIAMLGSFFATALCVSNLEVSKKDYMFTPIDGRAVIVAQDGGVIDENELKALADDVGAESYLSFDYLLDNVGYASVYIPGKNRIYSTLTFTFDEEVKLHAGRMPESDNEAVLVLPIAWSEIYGCGELLKDYVALYGGDVILDVCGVSYYYDNTKPYGKVIMTKEGFENISNTVFLRGDYTFEVSVKVKGNIASGVEEANFKLKVDPRLKAGEAYATGKYKDALIKNKGLDVSFRVTERDKYTGYEKISYLNMENAKFIDAEPRRVGADESANVTYYGNNGMSSTIVVEGAYGDSEACIYVSSETAKNIVDKMGRANYTQGSLFFESDKAAKDAKGEIRDLGYVAALSNATYTSENIIIAEYLQAVLMIGLWILIILFLTFFLSLCSSRVIMSRRGDLAILRSMGIENKVVKISMYAQMLVAAAISMVALVFMSLVLYLNPATNPVFPYMHLPQYAMIILGVLIINIWLTKKYNKKIFSESVRKTLRGGQRES